MTSQTSGRRRKLLAGSALGLLATNVLPAGRLAAPCDSYLARLRAALGLVAASGATAHRIRACVHLCPGAQNHVAKAAVRLEAAIGEEWQTAAHTIPSLVDEDLRLARTVPVGGLLLTAVELALLVG